MNRSTLSVSVFLMLMLTACSSLPVTQVSVQSYELQAPGATPATALSQLVGVFVERGFDVKMSNADSGVVTTEYKKFASIDTNPPFDYYMQVRAKLRTTADGASIRLTPIVKEQNRLNLAAFSEHELIYFIGDPEGVQTIGSMSPNTGWRMLGQVLFMNVVTETATALKVDDGAILRNESKLIVDARAFEN